MTNCLQAKSNNGRTIYTIKQTQNVPTRRGGSALAAEGRRQTKAREAKGW